MENDLEIDTRTANVMSGVCNLYYRDKELRKKGYKIISIAEQAKLRIESGRNAPISRYSNFVSEIVICNPPWTRQHFGKYYGPSHSKCGSLPILVKNPPNLNRLMEALEDCGRYSSRGGGEGQYNIDWAVSLRKKVSEILEKIVENDSMKVPFGDINIHTNRFDKEPLTLFMFGGEKQAREYGDFLADAGIAEMNVCLHHQDLINCKGLCVQRVYLGGINTKFDGIYGEGCKSNLDYRTPLSSYIRTRLIREIKKRKKSNVRRFEPSFSERLRKDISLEPELLDLKADYTCNPAQLMRKKELKDLIFGAVMSLPEQQRDVVISCIAHNIPLTKYADSSGLNYSNVRNMFSKGLDKLQRFFYNHIL